MEVYVWWDPGRACAVRPRYVSVKGSSCRLILVAGPCARGRMCCEACTRALRDNFAMHAPSQVVGITEHLRRHHGLMVSTGKGASAVIPCLSFPAERPRRRSHHLRRDHQVEYGVRKTQELDLTRKPDLLQVVLAGCEEAAAAARASERPAICPWVETAQRPTRTRKSGNTQLQEAPSCFEAEEMEEGRAH